MAEKDAPFYSGTFEGEVLIQVNIYFLFYMYKFDLIEPFQRCFQTIQNSGFKFGSQPRGDALVGKKGGDYIFKDSYENQPTSQMPEEASYQFGCRVGWWIEFKNVSLK